MDFTVLRLVTFLFHLVFSVIFLLCIDFFIITVKVAFSVFQLCMYECLNVCFVDIITKVLSVVVFWNSTHTNKMCVVSRPRLCFSHTGSAAANWVTLPVFLLTGRAGGR